jgi:hypothetical protein
MAAKGSAQANAAFSNQYKLEIPGLPDTFFTRVGELERMVTVAEMPDKTQQTTGQINPGEFEADQLLHHAAERAALEALLNLTATGTLGHKIVGTMHYLGSDGASVKLSVLIDGLMVKGRKLPEVNSGEDGEAVNITWTLAYDDLIFLG